MKLSRQYHTFKPELVITPKAKISLVDFGRVPGSHGGQQGRCHRRQSKPFCASYPEYGTASWCHRCTWPHTCRFPTCEAPKTAAHINNEINCCSTWQEEKKTSNCWSIVCPTDLISNSFYPNETQYSIKIIRLQLEFWNQLILGTSPFISQQSIKNIQR